MRRIWLIALLLTLIGTTAVSAKKNSEDKLNYQIEGGGTATQGTYLVVVTLTTSDKKVSDADLCRAAVHGVLFRGFSNANLRQSQKPLAGSAANEAQHIDFYKEFFSDNGTADNYASVVSGTRSITKAGKDYRVNATVTVNKEALLKYLQDVGVVKGLNSAF